LQEIYLDNSATTRCLPAAAEAAEKALTSRYGNPSSLHRKGVNANELIKGCRRQASALLSVKPEQIYFTSGGTEANNLALMGAVDRYKEQGSHIITSEIEHPSVYRPLKELEKRGFEVTRIQTDAEGIIDPDKVASSLRPDTILISIMQVNNETGSIQPVEKIGEIAGQQHLPLFHVDAVQGLGKLATRPAIWQTDLATFSGHKVHAPMGSGFLYVREQNMISPLIRGGGQERGLRSGTENVPALAGLKAALEELPALKQGERDEKLEELREYLLSRLQKKLPSAVINSPAERCAPHLVNFSLPGIKGEVMVNALSRQNIFISTGSACTSNSSRLSRVLKAIDLSQERIEGALRISLSRFNSRQDIDRFIEVCREESRLLFS